MNNCMKNILLCLLSGLLLCACHHHEELDKKARRTVIAYIVAENSLDSFIGEDLREMLSAKDSIPLDCNFVVYLDNTSMPTLYTYSTAGKTLIKTYPEQDSCDSLTFRNTLAEIIEAYPAEEYALIMWSHGSGWIPCPKTSSAKGPRKTIGVDSNNNTTSNTGTELEIPVMRRMLEDLNVHWNYIFFDACFMQGVEVDYELRNLCDYIIASPAEIPGEGAPYNLVMKSFFKEKGAAESIANIYHQANINKTYGSTKGGLIISVAQTNKMEALANHMKPLVIKLFSNKQEYSLSKAQAYCNYNAWSVWKPEYHDLGSAMNQLLNSPVEYQQLVQQLQQTYPVNLHTDYWLSEFFSNYQGVVYDVEHLASVSMFFPHSKYEQVNYNNRLHDYQWYKAAGWDQTGW